MEAGGERSHARSIAGLVAAIAILAVAFVWASLVRFIDRDEGFYLLGARVVLECKLPYRDFFYTQTFLVPYLYAVPFAIAGRSWTVARLFTAGLAIGIGVGLYADVKRRANVPLALGAVLLLAT